jgi:16S rRNA (cytosine1402-N4)-methyltransferase
VELIKKAKPITSLLKKGHPAKQIFQALRIEVNGELDNLQQASQDFPSMMAPGGRVVFISFQSLEDRLVKEKFHSLTVVEGDRHAPVLLPGEAPEAPYLALTKKPVEPSEEEKTINHRATSAKLRAIQKKGD